MRLNRKLYWVLWEMKKQPLLNQIFRFSSINVIVVFNVEVIDIQRSQKEILLIKTMITFNIYIHFKVMFLCPFALIFRRKFWDKVDTNTTKNSDFPINNAVVLSKNANELMLMRFSFVYTAVTPYMPRSVNMGCPPWRHDWRFEGLCDDKRERERPFI